MLSSFIYFTIRNKKNQITNIYLICLPIFLIPFELANELPHNYMTNILESQISHSVLLDSDDNRQIMSLNERNMLAVNMTFLQNTAHFNHIMLITSTYPQIIMSVRSYCGHYAA